MEKIKITFFVFLLGLFCTHKARACDGIISLSIQPISANICVNTQVSLISQYSLAAGWGADSVIWSVNGNSLASKNNIDTAFSTPGNYNVEVILFASNDSVNCSDTSNITIAVHKVTAKIQPLPSLICSGQTVFFSSAGSAGATKFTWAINGNGYNTPNVNKSFLPGVGNGQANYIAKLTTENNYGCVAQTQVNFAVKKRPNIQQITKPDSVCSGSSFTVGANAQGNNLSYAWNVGGTNYNIENPTHTFNTPNGNNFQSKNIFLRVTSGEGCNYNDSANATMVVKPKPLVDFAFSDGLCSPATMLFTNNSTYAGSNPTYAWVLGNGINSNQKNPTTTYAVKGFGVRQINVKLTVNALGCSHASTKVVEVKEGPELKFRPLKEHLCWGTDSGQVKILSMASIPKTIVNWGDGVTDTVLNWSNSLFNHTYTQINSYTISLLSTGSNQCVNDTTINITYAKKPTVVLKYPIANEVCEGDIVTLENRTDPILLNTTYTFNFDDKSDNITTNGSEILADSSLRIINYKYNTNCNGSGFGGSSTVPGLGGYKAVLTAQNGCGFAEQSWEPIRIYPLPKPNFNANRVCKSDTTTLENISTFESCFSTTTAKYTWYFGDGDSAVFDTVPILPAGSVQQTIQHVYPDTGTYIVTLIACDDALSQQFGCNCATYSAPVIIQKPPIVRFGAHRACLHNATVFNDNSFARNGANIISRRWFLGDGDSIIGVSGPSHVYAYPDTFMVTQIITDEYGCTDSANRPVIVDPLPISDFIADTVCYGSATTLTSLSNSKVKIDLLTWIFGSDDTLQTTLPQVEYTYANAGVILTRLTVKDSLGCQKDTLKEVLVWDNPVANFSFDNNICQADSVQFINETTLGDTMISQYFWDFGNGHTSNLKNPKSYFAAAGSYTVRLMVLDVNGCESTIQKQLTVQSKPTANFITNTPCRGQATFFVDSTNYYNSTNNTQSWFLGLPGATFIGANPSYTYPDSGKYEVLLIATTENGCSDTLMKQASVNPNPVANFLADTVCLHSLTNLTNTSVSFGKASIVTNLWHHADTVVSNSQNAALHFLSAGTHEVRLYVQDTYGCTDSATKQVRVRANPIANIMANEACEQQTVNFINNSEPVEGALIENIWNFGDFSLPDSSYSPKHTYSTAGFYTVTLSVKNSVGCHNSTTTNISVFEKPNANFSADLVCEGVKTSFANVSGGVSGQITNYKWLFDTLETSSLSNPSYLFPAAGLYNVRLIIENSKNCVDSVERQVTVYKRPIANYTAQSVCQGETVDFINQSQTNGGAAITSYKWYFNANDSSQAANPSRVFASAGLQNVTLIANNANNCQAIQTQQIKVHPKPIALFSVPAGCQADSILFAHNASVAEGAISNVHWNFGDGSPTVSANQVWHFYNSSGNYQVKLNVTATNGCRDSTYRAVAINSPPIIDFEYANSCEKQNIFFKPTVDQANTSQLIWYFGNGDSSTVYQPTYTFDSAGTYTVTLKVKDTLGCAALISKQIKILRKPNANFYFTNTCFNQKTQFSDSSNSYNGAINKYLWQMGDSTTANLPNPNHQYAAAAQYTVVLTIEDAGGCTDTAERQITIRALPKASFSNQIACKGANVQFFSTSLDADGQLIDSTKWDFDNGFLSNETNPNTVFALANDYWVRLAVTDSKGCQDTTKTKIKVQPLPVANFVADTVCLHDSTSFSNLSHSQAGVPLVGSQWGFGNGETLSGHSVRYKFAQPGAHTVQLTVTDSLGCSAAYSNNIWVNPLPVARFSFNTNTCFGSSYLFTNNSLAASLAPIVSNKWHVSNGDTSAQYSPKFYFNTAGTYKVSLTVADALGCFDDTSATFTASPSVQANFSVSNTCIGQQPVQIYNTSNLFGNAVSSAKWFMGDGHIIVSTSDSLQHSYANAGTYQIKLIITTAMGCVDSVTKSITIYEPPTANFSANSSCEGTATSFLNTSQLSGSGASLSSFSYNFADGLGLSNLPNPQYIYKAAGVYNASLTVSDQNGCADTITRQVEVYANPTAVILANNTCQNTQVVLNGDNSVAAGGASLTSYSWRIGSTLMGATNVLYYSFSTPGVKPVSLQVTDSRGCSASTTKNINIFSLPNANFKAPLVCGNQLFEFNNLSATTGGLLTNYHWTFGDGTGSIFKQPLKKYNAPGTYNVRLIVTDENNCKDTIVKPIIAYGKPVANFYSDTVCFGTPTTFVNTSTGTNSPIVASQWLMQDSVLNQTAPSYVFSNYGAQNVVLHITDSVGCADTVANTAFVAHPPIAAFGFLKSCIYDTTKFSNTSAQNNGGPIVGSAWRFSNGITSTADNPQVVIDSSSIWALLTVENENGCNDSVSKKVETHPQPFVNFAVQIACLGNPVLFNNLSSGVGVGIATSAWRFGDQGVSTEQNPVHFYDSAGNYLVQLSVTDQNGCVNDTAIPTTIYPKPKADFSFTTSCSGASVSFTNQSVVAGNNVTYAWRFGDGIGNSTMPNPVYAYANSGVFSVRLIAFDSLGCSDTIVKQIDVSGNPIVNFSVPPACIGSSSEFTQNSQSTNGSAIISYKWYYQGQLISNLQNPVYKFSTAGNHPVTLVIEDSLGCGDSLVKTAQVLPQPLAQFSVPTVCYHDSTKFKQLSVGTNSSLTTYAWEFGNGNTSAKAQPTYYYTDYGQYAVRLVVTDSNHCKDTAQNIAKVLPPPSVDFTYTTACAGKNISFTDQSHALSGKGLSTWVWHFDTLGLKNQQNPNFSFPVSATYPVRLTVTDSNLCSNIITKLVSVLHTPQPVIAADTSCLGQPTQFTNITPPQVSPIVLAKWIINTDTTTGNNPVYTFAQSGMYPATLQLTDANGCTGQATKFVPVLKKPQADFLITNSCLGQPTVFQNTSNNMGHSLDTALWLLGDGNKSHALNAHSHTYATIGAYTATLIITVNNGCSDTISKTTAVFEGPKAAFTANRVCKGAQSVLQSTSLAGSNPILGYQWKTTSSLIGTDNKATLVFNTAGTKSVQLLVTDSQGCVDSTQGIVLVDSIPKANFAFANVCFPDSVAFTNLSKGRGASLVSFAWTFENKDTTTTKNPVYNFGSAGNFSVKLTVKDQNGCQNDTTHPVAIQPKPLANFMASNHCLGTAVKLQNQSNVVADTLTSFVWDLGNSTNSTLSNPAVQYTDTGVFSVSLIAQTQSGCADTITKPIRVFPNPKVQFSVTKSCFGQPNQYTDNSETFGRSVASQSWLLGDGSAPLGGLLHTQHTYGSPGVYAVGRVVTSADGCADTAFKNAVVDSLPAPFFMATNVCMGNMVSFKNHSKETSNQVKAYKWDFGNGTDTIIFEPDFLFAQPGSYIIKLTATDMFGCSAAYTKALTVYDLPAFNVTSQIACNNDTTQLLATPISSQHNYTFNWQWQGLTFGQNPFRQQFATGGSNTILVTAIDSNGCQHTTTQQINVPKAPTANFTYNDTCLGMPTQLFDLSVADTASDITSHRWINATNGNLLSTTTNPTVSFLASGSSLIKLIIEDKKGCTDSIIKPVVTRNLPNVWFAATESCVGDTLQYQAMASTSAPNNSIAHYNWSFGDSTAPKTTQNPLHVYSLEGRYQIRLTVTDATGCRNIYADSVLVNPLPIPDFVVTNTCEKRKVTFKDSSLMVATGAGQYFWRFGNGVNSTGSVAQNVFDTAGQYTISLRVVNSKGCTRSVTKLIKINPNPKAAINHDTACAKNTMGFNDASVAIGSQPITEWKWHFADGDSSGLQHPNKIFKQHGYYKVRLKVKDDNNCYAHDSTLVLVRPLPIPVFTFTPKCPGIASGFDNQSNTVYSTDSIVAQSWHFGDATSASNLHSPTHVYQAPGQYTVTLRVVDNNSCADSLQKRVNIPVPPVPRFYALGSCAKSQIVFIDTSIRNNAQIISRVWDFGDGTVASGDTVQHVFAQPGNYLVTLTIADTSGCTRQVAKNITINKGVRADFAFVKACLGDTTFFVNQSVDGGVAFTKYAWWVNGAQQDTTENFKIKFDNTGVFPVSLIVEDANGCRDSLVKQVEVYPKPLPYFDAPLTCLGGYTAFQNQTASVGAPIEKSIWAFGDGTNLLNNQNPLHLYNNSGFYVVKLTVEDTNKCQASYVDSVEVKANPVAAFNVLSTCVNDSVQFVNNSTAQNGVPFNSFWHINNTFSLTTKNPKIYADSVGLNTAMLVVTDMFGCKDTVVGQYNILPRPTAMFTANAVCQGKATTFANASLGFDTAQASYQWHFADGNTSAQRSPVHTYLNAGNYNVSMVFTDGSGCMDTANQTVAVKQRPVAAISANVVGCLGTKQIFTDASSSTNGPVVAWHWQIGNGLQQSFLPSTIFNAPDTGVFAVKLHVVDSGGCADTAQTSISIKPKPTTAIVAPNVYCVQNAVPFALQSNLPIVNYIWQFGDGFSSTSSAPTHSYTQTGNYAITTIAATEFGCTDTARANINIHTFALPALTKSHDSACGPANINMFSTSVGVVEKLVWDFGNGASDTLNQATTVQYLPGLIADTTYYITLAAINQCGSKTITDSIKIFAQPVARFQLSADSGCAPLGVNLINKSLGSSETYFWDFGNGNISTLPQPPKQYFTTPPTDTTFYQVALTAVNNCGTDTARQTVRVFPNLVKAFFNVDKTFGCQGVHITFTDFAQAATSYFYDFGDGHTSTTANPIHTFNQHGTFMVQQIVTNGCGFDTATQTITVFPKPHFNLEVSPNDTVCQGADISFINNSQFLGGVVWYFGNGDSTQLAAPKYAYQQPGLFNVTVKGTSVPNGCVADTSFSLLVHPKPNAQIDSNIFNKLHCEQASVVFSNQAGNALYHKWYFGDADTSWLHSPTHQYTQPGTYTVKLVAENIFGCTDADQNQIVIGKRPNSHFTMSSTYSCDSLPKVWFTDASVDAFNVGWDFGNATQAQGVLANTTFQSAGVYAIRHTAYAINGCTDTSTQFFEAINPPIPNFGLDSGLLSSNSICLGDILYLENLSVNYDSLIWDFGQGDLQYNQNSSFTYFRAGLYNITLTAFNKQICTDTLTKHGFVRMNPKPKAKFYYQNIDTLYQGRGVSFGRVDFYSQSLLAEVLYWDFGDSATLTTRADTATHRYLNTGSYLVGLTVTTDSGCVDSTQNYVNVDYFADLHMPNAIYPEGASNDIAVFIGKGIFLETYKIAIYDTWGKIVWAANGVDSYGRPASQTAWTGRDAQNQLLPAGAYVYKVVYKFKYDSRTHVKTGDVTILR